MNRIGQLDFQNNLDDIRVFANGELNPLLRAALKKIDLPFAPQPKSAELYWDAGFFGLPALGLYQCLNAEQQKSILWHCNRMALEEAFYIEKSGMTYAAKMSLLADTNDKRALYNLFCADEASHFHAINAFMLDQPRPYQEQKFLIMLDALINDGSYNVLVYMIQIILEGWGLYHYRNLAAHCRHEPLAQVLRAIIHDEAKHHGSGLVILPQERWTPADSRICLPALREFLELVRIGPTNLLQAFEAVLGPLSTDARLQLFEESDSPVAIAENLKTLASFVSQHCPDQKLMQQLESSAVLTPATAREFCQKTSE